MADCFDPARDLNREAQETAHLKSFGYAPGDYYSTCIDCARNHISDKRAWRCVPCAQSRFEAAHTAERADDYDRMAEVLGTIDDAEILAALTKPGARLVAETEAHDHVFYRDLPDFVQAFIACNSGPATEVDAIERAGIMPKVYATWTPPEGSGYGSQPIRVRITMVSRLGDVGISREDKETGYFTRLPIFDLTDFDTVMHPEAPARRVHPLVRYAIADKHGRWVRINPSPNVLSPIALSPVPVLYESRKKAYKDKSAVDPSGMKGLQTVEITLSARKRD